MKPGDTVECIDISGINGLTIGKQYTVQEVFEKNGMWYIKITANDSGLSNSGYYISRFKLVQSNNDLADRVVKALYDLVDVHKHDKVHESRAFKQWKAAADVLKELGLEIQP